MTKRGLHLFFAIICITMLAACTQQRTPCYEPKIVPVNIGIYRISDTVAVDTSLSDPAFYCLDTSVGQARGAANKFAALLSPFVDSTRWVLAPDYKYNDEDTVFFGPESYDTVTFYHNRRMEFISNACGYVFYYDLTNVRTTKNSIDSVILLNNSVDNNADVEHIKIFY